MKQLLNGKRVFEQDSDVTRFLIFSGNDIHNYYYFYEEVAIKKGDVLYPQKWIKYSGSSLIKAEKFDFADYEYIFILDKWTENDIKEALQPFFEVDEQFTSILTLNKLPDGAEQIIREVLGKAAYKEDNIMTVEAYAYPNEENRFIILNSEVTDDDISYEYTRDFTDIVILATYNKVTEGQIEYLYKTAPQKHIDKGNIYSSSEERWFHRSSDPTNNFIVLKQIYDIEDMLQLTNFQLD
jgi:hypothetical protein